MADQSNSSGDGGSHEGDAVPATIGELAQRLIALETHRGSRPTKSGVDAANACNKLRLPLAKLTGKAGYHSLITRALAIAKAKHPTLVPIEVRIDGSLKGFDELEQHDPQAGAAVLIQLLSLLVTFIGEPLTQSLVRDAWPEATWETNRFKRGEQQ